MCRGSRAETHTDDCYVVSLLNRFDLDWNHGNSDGDKDPDYEKMSLQKGKSFQSVVKCRSPGPDKNSGPGLDGVRGSEAP